MDGHYLGFMILVYGRMLEAPDYPSGTRTMLPLPVRSGHPRLPVPGFNEIWATHRIAGLVPCLIRNGLLLPKTHRPNECAPGIRLRKRDHFEKIFEIALGRLAVQR